MGKIKLRGRRSLAVAVSFLMVLTMLPLYGMTYAKSEPEPVAATGETTAETEAAAEIEAAAGAAAKTAATVAEEPDVLAENEEGEKATEGESSSEVMLPAAADGESVPPPSGDSAPPLSVGNALLPDELVASELAPGSEGEALLGEAALQEENLAAQAKTASITEASFNTFSLPEISVRVEYSDSFGGPYFADYEFIPDGAGGDIIIRNPNTGPGCTYVISVTVEGYGETVGATGPINEVLGSFSITGGSSNPENPDGMLLLGFRVHAYDISGPAPEEPELYYRVTGRVFEVNAQNGEGQYAERPLTYDPARFAFLDRPQISVTIADQRIDNLGQVAPDGSFELYLLKALIDALSNEESVFFEINSPYASHHEDFVPVSWIREDSHPPIHIKSKWAGVVHASISRGHLPADIIYNDAEAYLPINFMPIGNSGNGGITYFIPLNGATDPIPIYLPSIEAGDYLVSFRYAPELWDGGTIFQWYNGATTMDAASVVSVRAFEDLMGINTVSWAGDRDHAGTGDVYGPVVTDVSPLGNNQAPTGEFVITFNEPIDPIVGGTVRLVGVAEDVDEVVLATGSWSGDAKVYTVAYAGLANGRLYQVEVSGFKDVAGNTMGTDDNYSLVVQNGEVPRVFEHEASGIRMSGNFTPDATLSVIEGLAGIHPYGTDAACDVLHRAHDRGLLLSVHDVTVHDGRFVGPVSLTIPVGAQYNGQTVFVLHCKDGELEKIEATVTDGAVTFSLTSLSPIGIVLPQALDVSTEGYDFDATTGTLAVKTNAGTTEWQDDPSLSDSDIQVVVIEDTVTVIGTRAFASCENLTSLDLTAFTGVIGEMAFQSAGLTALTIPAGITDIEDYAFEDSALAEVTFLGSTPPNIGSCAFDLTAGSGRVHYPKSNDNAYEDILDYFPSGWIKAAFEDTSPPAAGGANDDNGDDDDGDDDNGNDDNGATDDDGDNNNGDSGATDDDGEGGNDEGTTDDGGGDDGSGQTHEDNGNNSNDDGTTDDEDGTAGDDGTTDDDDGTDDGNDEGDMTDDNAGDDSGQADDGDDDGDDGDATDESGDTTEPSIYSVSAHFGGYTGSGTVEARIDADHSKFLRLRYNGVEVDPSNYTIAQGSTIITLQESYLETLGNGTHWFVAEYSDGRSEGIKLVVSAAGVQGATSDSDGSSATKSSGGGSPDSDKIPGTGDSSSSLLWLIASVATMAGILCLVICRKRQRVREN